MLISLPVSFLKEMNEERDRGSMSIIAFLERLALDADNIATRVRWSRPPQS